MPHPRQQTKRTKSMDMTSGSIIRLLIAFSVPLLLGNLFQQLYNTVDSLVVGNFVGREALAAVGSTTSIINTMISFFNGVSIGAGVIISRHYGAHNDKKLHLAVETTMGLTFICGFLLTGLGILLAPAMLRFMSTPEDVFESALIYLQIYFAGGMGLLVYNMGSAILRAVGDTRRPLLFLIFSSIVNIALDLLFVIVFRMGIAGVAYATIIAQFASSILVLWVLTKSTENYQYVWKDTCVDRDVFRQILVIGLPAGLQQAVTAFSNVYVQSYINRFGSSSMAGWSCYIKVDQIVLLPLQSMAQAATTFVSQNVGAEDIPRAKKGSFQALGMSAAITLASAVILWVFAPQLVYLFNQEEEVIYYGVIYMRMSSVFTVFCCPNMIISGALRGIGDSKTPMFIMLFSFVLFRQIYLYLATSIANTPYVVGFGYPAGWIVCSVIMTAYYLSGKWEKKLA